MFKTRTRTKVLIGATAATGIGAVICGHMEKEALAKSCDDLIALNIGDAADGMADDAAEAINDAVDAATSFTA